MAKRRKISRKRIEDIRQWLLEASDERLERYTSVIPKSLQMAAASFHLDPESERHREILVRVLAHLMFGRGKRGRPPMTLKWHPGREIDLGFHFSELKREKPNIKYSEAAKIIMQRYRKEYADCKVSALRQRMPAAYASFMWMEEQFEEHQRQQEQERQREPVITL